MQMLLVTVSVVGCQVFGVAVAWGLLRAVLRTLEVSR